MGRLWNCIKRFFYWGWKLRNSHDWDHDYFLEVMYLKLKRMEQYQITQGISVDSEDPDSEMRKSMRVALKLLERLRERSGVVYAVGAEAKFNAKWGNIEIVETPYKEGMMRVRVKRKNVTDENEKTYEMESRQLAEFNNEIYTRDKRLLFNIIAEYIDYWWD